MRPLLTTLAGALLLLAALDRVVPVLLIPAPTARAIAVQSVNDERDRAFSHIVAMHFDELRANVRRLVDATHARWQGVPDHKSSDELRVCIIGNSAALFALVPRIVEERLAAAFPRRTVRVIPLILPGITVADELPLVRAAVAKHADVIVLTPNVKDLVAKGSGLGPRLHELFDDSVDASTYDPASRVGRLLERHWRLYRERDELRSRFLRAVTWTSSRDDGSTDEGGRLQTAFTAIAAAAQGGNMAELVETYRRHGMSSLLTGPSFRERLPASSPVFGLLAKLAAEVRKGHAHGVAIFLPLNPIFRSADATVGFETLHVDDAYVRALAEHTLASYGADFTTFDRIDALPASAFIDLVHVNADGMATFSSAMAESLVEAVQAMVAAPAS
jgi:hypothetical protein